MQYGYLDLQTRKKRKHYKRHGKENMELEPFVNDCLIKEIAHEYIMIDYPSKLPLLSKNNEIGNKSRLPKPRGLSGSAVWLISKETVLNPETIGIAVEYYESKQLIKIIPSKFILELLSSSKPNVK
jgi:hypothetical protein